MSANQLWTWQRATALVPLALLSVAWTASLAVGTTASAASEDGGKLPDGSTVPTEAIEAPASVSVPGEIAPGVPEGAADSIIASSDTNGIPAAALAAYQRAAQVLESADPSCHISWPLIAAIGRVESNHGRYGGNTLGDDGVSRPGIFGIPLDGSNGTARIADTDAGDIDDDPIFDRAVGPMQFIPSTWSVVGVDGDGDGVRNPQDIDDAALATAVYLCSGDEDLSTERGLRSAVYRYNHSQQYVDLVLSIMAAYSQGDFSSIPNGTLAPATFAPTVGQGIGGFGGGEGDKAGSRDRDAGGKSGGGSDAGTTDGGSGGGGGSTGGDSSTGDLPSLPDTGGDSADGDGGGSSGPVDDATGDAGGAVEDTLTPLQEATNYCQSNSGALSVQACVQAYLNGGTQAVQNAIDAITDPVGDVTGGGGAGDVLDDPLGNLG